MAAKSFQWDPKATWEVNIAAAIEAQNARKVWSVERRAKHGKAIAAGHKRRRAKERKAKIARANEREKERKMGKPWRPMPPELGKRRCDQVLRVMEPGEWYAAADLSKLSGCEYAKSILPHDMQRPGREWVEKGANADYNGWQRASRIPKFLWRLTPSGEAARELLIMLD